MAENCPFTSAKPWPITCGTEWKVMVIGVPLTKPDPKRVTVAPGLTRLAVVARGALVGGVIMAGEGLVGVVVEGAESPRWVVVPVRRRGEVAAGADEFTFESGEAVAVLGVTLRRSVLALRIPRVDPPNMTMAWADPS